MLTMTTSVWVRLRNFPIHFTHLELLEKVGNLIVIFVKIDMERLSKSIFTYVHICVEVNLYKGLLDKIELKWLENVYFQQAGHLQSVCPFLNGSLSLQATKNSSYGWRDPKEINESKVSTG